MRVADQADFRANVLVQVVRINRRVNEFLPGRHGDAERRLGKAATRAENPIGFFEKMRDGARKRQAT